MSAYPPEKAGSPGAHTLPTRSTTLSEDRDALSDEEAISDTKPSDTTGILLERLQAWKHACGYVENYVAAMEKMEKSHAKDYDKVLKTISSPLREGEHFAQELGGIAGFFESMRSNTQGIQNSYLESAKNLDGSVMPTLKRLHGEIKNKHKELTNGAGKAAKAVDAAQNSSQKYIELLGQHSAAFDSAAHAKLDAHQDPYVLHRGTQHRLHKQVLEENNGRHDLLAVQRNFADFEGHVIQVLQQAMGVLGQIVGGHADRSKAMYGDVVGSLQRVPLDFEWKLFSQRRADVLLDPNAPARQVQHITYPNMDHAATKPLLAGTLERKSRAGVGSLGGYKPAFYAVTPAGYLHQFADDDNFRKDPTPELSLYLPDCTVGAVADTKFHIKGKDASKGKVGSALAMSHEISFKAHTPSDAQKWHEVIAKAAGGHSNEPPPESAVTSPINTASGASMSGDGKLPQRTTSLGTQSSDATAAQPEAHTTAGPTTAAGSVPIKAATDAHPQTASSGAQSSGFTDVSSTAPTATTSTTTSPTSAGTGDIKKA